MLAPYYPYIVNECKKLFNKGNTIHLDLANDIYITIACLPSDKIGQLITQNKLEAYISTAIRNERRGSSSRFARLYKREINYITIPDSSCTIPLSFESLNRLPEFYKKFLSLYIVCGTVEEASRRSRINKQTIVKYLNTVKELLK